MTREPEPYSPLPNFTNLKEAFKPKNLTSVFVNVRGCPTDNDNITFKCPYCKHNHTISIKGDNLPITVDSVCKSGSYTISKGL